MPPVSIALPLHHPKLADDTESAATRGQGRRLPPEKSGVLRGSVAYLSISMHITFAACSKCAWMRGAICWVGTTD